MAQKVNPIAVRLGYNRQCDSNWFSDYYYSTLLSQDYQIRRYLKRFPRSIIYHSINKTSIFLFCFKALRRSATYAPKVASPVATTDLPSKKSYLLSTAPSYGLSALHPVYNKQYIPIQVNSIYQSASLLAQAICSKLEQNKSLKQIARTIIRECEQIHYIKGIRLVCSGRLNGAEMAKTVCHKYGETSLHVFSDRIDYASMSANTPYGLLGVKVWISIK